MPEIDLGTPAEKAVAWMQTHLDFLFAPITDVITALAETMTSALTETPQAVLIGVFAALTLPTRRWGLTAYTLLTFLLIAGMGLWVDTMQTMALVLLATLIALVIGIPLGIAAAFSRSVSVTLRPVMDVMQTLPVFVYLIPAVFFFGIGPAPGIVATIVFALPPAVRLTELGIRGVDADTVEAAEAIGASPLQVLREVQLPLASGSIMAGVNQVIMLSLSMVVVAGLVGADGLGTLVVRAVSSLDVAGGIQSGLAVVVLAIYLDRLTQALSHGLRPGRARRRTPRAVPAAAVA
ncbi:proline/glycine betaine ABC transporter permease [Nocardioides sp. L-11A]|uniref:ABC transporter permease n=1 Tax=Nocardioides sp. L-11A TaxID=3043848 RepID=UPI00249BED51|nr:ABC transporter permease subunit [Nocardioides sp. L-11A]